MKCIWNVNPEDRHCEYCLALLCEDRKNEQDFDSIVYPNKVVYNEETGEIIYIER